MEFTDIFFTYVESIALALLWYFKWSSYYKVDDVLLELSLQWHYSEENLQSFIDFGRYTFSVIATIHIVLKYTDIKIC